MGKRKKGDPKYNKNTKTKITCESNTVKDVTEEISSLETTGNGKKKKIVFNNEESSKVTLTKVTNDLNTNLPERENKNTRSNNKHAESNVAKQNKKIIFTDDNDSGTEITAKKVRKTKISPLEEPGDEEIDKFCDELDEEDNVQFDNWVKLIEAKLASNKKE